MKLKEIRIKNFRGLGAFQAETDRTTLFLTGLNGAGKTTVLQALQMALFGRCFDAAGKRIQMADMVGPAGTKARIRVLVEVDRGDLAGDVVLDCTITARGQTLTVARRDGVLLLDGPQAGLRDQFWRAVGMDRRHAELAANPRPYCLGDEISDLLLELCGNEVSRAELRAFAGPRWPWLEGWLNGHPDLSIGGIADKAVEERRATKRRMEDLKDRIKALGGVERPRLKSGRLVEPDDLPALRDRLAELRAELQARQVDLEVARRQAGQAAPDPEAARLAHQQAVEAAEAAQEALETAQAELDACAKEVAGQSHQSHMLLTERERLERQLKGLRGASETCETCGARWTKERRRQREEPLENRIAELKQQSAELQAASKVSMDRQDAARQAARQAAEKAQAAQGELARAQEALRAAEASKVPQGDPEELARQVETLTAQVAAGEQIVRQAEQWMERTIAEEDLTREGTTLDNLEWAVECFRDGRFQAGRVDGPRAEFERACNEVLEGFGLRLRVERRDGLVRVEVSGESGPPVPVAQLSKGERVLVEAAVALAYNPGAIICLDDLDALDSGNKGALLGDLESSSAMVVCAGAWGLRDRNLEPLRAFLHGAVVWVGAQQPEPQEVAA